MVGQGKHFSPDAPFIYSREQNPQSFHTLVDLVPKPVVISACPLPVHKARLS